MSTAHAVLDTHVLLWHTLDPEQLSGKARQVLERCEDEGAVVSAISLWEIAIKVKRAALTLPLSTKAYWKRLQELRWLEVRPVDAETWLASVDLDWPHRDPADRVIVATATALGLPIVTKDTPMHTFYRACVW